MLILCTLLFTFKFTLSKAVLPITYKMFTNLMIDAHLILMQNRTP